MKSFRQYIIENWSLVKDPNNIPAKKREKFVYHITHKDNIESILDDGLQPTQNTGTTNFIASNINDVYVTNHNGISSWIDILSSQKRHDEYVETGNPRSLEDNIADHRVLKFPIANLAKSLKRRIKMDVIGTRDATWNLSKRSEPERLLKRSDSPQISDTDPYPRGAYWSWIRSAKGSPITPIARAWSISKSIKE